MGVESEEGEDEQLHKVPCPSLYTKYYRIYLVIYRACVKIINTEASVSLKYDYCSLIPRPLYTKEEGSGNENSVIPVCLLAISMNLL